jgi:uncharacterized protein (DUF1684 family)
MKSPPPKLDAHPRRGRHLRHTGATNPVVPSQDFLYYKYEVVILPYPHGRGNAMDIRLKDPILAGLLVAAVTAGIAVAGEPEKPKTYKEEIQTWHAQRVERLTSPSGYLSVTGLYWLREGKNSFGAEPSSDIVFPADKAPANIGAFYLEGGRLRVEVQPGAGVRSGDDAVKKMRLHHDQDKEHDRTELTLGTLTWYAIKRGERFGIRLKDSDSETLRSFGEIESFSIDERWRIDGVFDAYDPVRTIPITSVGDIHTDEVSTGAVVFDIDGKTYRLDVLAEPGDRTLFVIFADETSGSETYGGGRFLYVDAPGVDGKVVIDFNKTYNPPCAFSAFTTCPLPPRQNHLPVRVTAGEKVYKKSKS